MCHGDRMTLGSHKISNSLTTSQGTGDMVPQVDFSEVSDFVVCLSYKVKEW